MPRIELIDPQLPLAQQLRDALRYPLLGEPADQHSEALQLLDRLASAWSDHPLHTDISAQRRRLASPA